MMKKLSSDAEYYLSWINEDTIIDPDDFLFHMDFGNGRELANSQLTRAYVRAPLVEINEYKPNFLSEQIKRDFNLIRMADQDDLTPTKSELNRLKAKLEKLTEDGQVKFRIKCLREDPEYEIENSIVSAQMIDVRDVMDFIDGVDLEKIYLAVARRRREFDSLTSGFRTLQKSK